MPSATIKAVITLLTGDNSFELQRSLDAIIAEFKGLPEKIDGADVTLAELPNLIMGATLFSDKRLVVIRSLSDNKPVWEMLADWTDKVSDDVHVVLVESKPDKRTRTYKTLQKMAIVHECKAWSDNDTATAEVWAINEARAQDWELSKKAARVLVDRVGVDQWLLSGALHKLAVLDAVDEAVVNDVVEAQPKENVFNLFEAALKGNGAQVNQMIKTLELTEDPYMVFGLLSGQVFQLTVLSNSDQSPKEIASAIGAHPFALSKLAPYGKNLGPAVTKKILTFFADADMAMKTSGGEPWLLIERALLKTIQVV